MRLLELAWCSTRLEFYLSLVLVSLTGSINVSTFFCLLCETAVVLYALRFPLKFCAGKIVVRQARIDPLAHA